MIKKKETMRSKNKQKTFASLSQLTNVCGEGGIRTLDTLLAYTHFPGVLFRPLRHLSGKLRIAKVK